MTTINNPQIPSINTNDPTQISEFKLLPSEIWFQILARLPAKILLKFRCVCKTWCSIIDHPHFIDFHSQLSQISNSRNITSFLAFEDFQDSRTSSILKLRHPETLQETDLFCINIGFFSYKIIGSCNGLILVSRGISPTGRDELTLWNPSICKSLLIPPCPFLSSGADTLFYVFGFAPASKDYKIVAFEPESSVKLNVAVYTLRDQQWRIRNNGLNMNYSSYSGLYGTFSYSNTSVFLKGVSYWIGDSNLHGNMDNPYGSFDFDKEEIFFSELPFNWYTSYELDTVFFLFLLGESVALFIISPVESIIWVLEQDAQNRRWTRCFSGESSQDDRNLFRGFSEKAFFREGHGGHFILGHGSYNIASRAVQVIEQLRNSNVRLEMYIENLVLSKGYGARDLRLFP